MLTDFSMSTKLERNASATFPFMGFEAVRTSLNAVVVYSQLWHTRASQIVCITRYV